MSQSHLINTSYFEIARHGTTQELETIINSAEFSKHIQPEIIIDLLRIPCFSQKKIQLLIKHKKIADWLETHCSKTKGEPLSGVFNQRSTSRTILNLIDLIDLTD